MPLLFYHLVLVYLQKKLTTTELHSTIGHVQVFTKKVGSWKERSSGFRRIFTVAFDWLGKC